MDINGTGGVQGSQPIRPVNRISSNSQQPAIESSAPRGDQAEISEVARLKVQLRDVPDIRLEKIERLRAEIEAGTYETPDKIDSVIDRLLEEL